MAPRAPALPLNERRAALVAAALPLVRERGGAVSTREIAEAAGIAEGTIFRAFGSKDELVQACVHEAFHTGPLIAGLRAVDAALPLEQRLATAVALLREHVDRLCSVLLAMGSPDRAHDVHRRAVVTEEGRRWDEQVHAALLDLIGADTPRLRVPPQRVLDFLRMLTLSSVHPMMARTPVTADEIVDVVLHGLLDGGPPAAGTTAAHRRSRGN